MDIMREIQLTRGLKAQVDDEDYEALNQFKWQANEDKYTFYVTRSLKIVNGRRPSLRMHRVVMNAPENMEVDHKDKNGLNNQKYNLRICTKAQNHFCQKPNHNSVSRYKGVWWREDVNKWQAGITPNGKRIHLGYFVSEIEAAKSYDAKAIEVFGKFARINIYD